MSPKVQEIYSQTVRLLPVPERLQLASLILAELTQQPQVIDYQDEWTEQDQFDLAAYAMTYAAQQYD